ncbi:MAG TPA: hypothetical protein VFZ34_10525 [Blastocatellia bacterium]|nr:hypothetical protein [Blastocatellia bacterium]
MQKLTTTLVAFTFVLLLCVSARAQNTMAADETYTVEYYYKTKWGYADEFLQLFKKNHLPVLKKQVEMGRITRLKIEKPRYHATEDGRWDFRVTLVFKNAAVAFGPSPEEEIIKQLYPDQATFRKEEQRRFEILLAHWDVPIATVPAN